MNTIAARIHPLGSTKEVATSTTKHRNKRLASLSLALLGSISLFGPGIAQASPATGYKEALTQVTHQQVSLKAEVKQSITTVKDRFPGAVLAACAPTGSMKPTLDENFIAVLEDCPFSRLGLGDIILARMGSGSQFSAVMHRIVDTEGMGGVRTQGDALKRADPLVTTTSNYLGKRVVAAINRQTGEISWLLREKAQSSRSL